MHAGDRSTEVQVAPTVQDEGAHVLARVYFQIHPLFVLDTHWVIADLYSRPPFAIINTYEYYCALSVVLSMDFLEGRT